jgi:hypothetical protein
MADNILTDGQKRSINKMVAQAFQEDLNGQLILNLESFKKQIDTIIKQMNLSEVSKKWVFLNHTARKNSLALRGYILIFKFRQFLLEEEIDYRYYYFDPQAGYSKAVSFKENDIVNYVKFGKNAIQINPTPLKKAELNQEYTAFISHFFTLYTVPDVNDYMRLISGTGYSGRIVRSNIMDTYVKSNPGLRKKNGQYQVFTRGHIYEAIDDAASEIMIKDENGSDDLVTKYVFGKYLAYDNIKATQGGDNPLTNTSIKSESADLYDYSTIKKQLIEIREIINSGLVDPAEAEQRIENLFMNKTKYATDEDYEASAQKALDNLLSVLKTNNS